MTGKSIRLSRIVKTDRRAVIVALDHGQFQGPMEGLVDLPATVAKIVAGQPDALILNPGALARHADLVAGRVGTILRITGAASSYFGGMDYHRLTTSVEHAVSLGADAVIVMGFIGGAGEGPSLQILGQVAEQCAKLGMPLVAEMLPLDVDHFTDPAYIASGTRLAYELGADVVKVYYTDGESFKRIAACVPIPVVLAGGPKGQDALEVARAGLQCGAAGVAYGRNVFQADDPTSYVARLVQTIHGS